MARHPLSPSSIGPKLCLRRHPSELLVPAIDSWQQISLEGARLVPLKTHYHEHMTTNTNVMKTNDILQLEACLRVRACVCEQKVVVESAR